MRLPRVHHEYLFRRLARRLGATVVCDVGAFDGRHSKRFRRTGLTVIAFEPNPYCFASMEQDPSIGRAGIRLVNAAAWNTDERLPFHVVTSAAKWHGSPRTSIGSVLARMPGYDLETYASVTVVCVRLDGVLAAEAGPLALWIDVEGAGYQVTEGMAGIRDRVCLVNIEIETHPFWQRQKLGVDVIEKMRELGFTPVARGPGGDVQFDVVFVNDRWLQARRSRIRSSIIEGRFRLALGAAGARLRQLWRPVVPIQIDPLPSEPKEDVRGAD